jgi:glycosyltransferase involved in cell wall biosynthesis
VIRSGVDAERFRPRNRAAARCRLGLSHEQPIVLFVGNLEPRKQVDVLVRALKQLPACLLLIVGSGESAGVDDQTAHLRELTRTLQLTDRVRFLGRLSADALLDCYAAANVFALPSSSEAQGIVALEAMASGLVVVASGVGGLLGTIEDGANGFLVRPGDADALALRLQTLLSRPELLDKVGAAARQTIEREFTWPRAISATLEVYRETLPCL